MRISISIQSFDEHGGFNVVVHVDHVFVAVSSSPLVSVQFWRANSYERTMTSGKSIASNKIQQDFRR